MAVHLSDSTTYISPDKINSQYGKFGFGVDPGELFGEGGLVQSLSKPFRQGLINPAAILIQTLAKSGNDLRNGRSLQDTLADPKNAIENQQTLGVNSKENSDYMVNPGIGGIKSGLGIGSYALSGILGKLLPAAGGVGSAIVNGGIKGAASGGAFGAGTAQNGDEIKNGILGLLSGGLLGGLLGGIGYQPSKTISVGQGSTQPTNPTPPQPIELFGPSHNYSIQSTGFLGKPITSTNVLTTPSQSNTGFLGKSLPQSLDAEPYFNGNYGQPVLDILNKLLEGSDVAGKVGATGEMGSVNPAINFLSGNRGVEQALQKIGFTPSSQQVSELAREVLNNYGDKIPSVLKPTIQIIGK